MVTLRAHTITCQSSFKSVCTEHMVAIAEHDWFRGYVQADITLKYLGKMLFVESLKI